MTGSKYLQPPVSTGSSFHLSPCVEVCDAFTPSHLGLWYKMPLYTSLTNSLCGAVTKFGDGPNGCSSVKPHGGSLGCICPVKLAACCISSVNTEGKRMFFVFRLEQLAAILSLPMKQISLRQTAYTKQRSSANPLLPDCVHTLQLMHPIHAKGLLGFLLGSSCIACFSSLGCSHHHQFL